MKEGRKPEYPEKIPDDELQKIPHTKARKFKPQPRLEPALQHRWQAKKADVPTMTPRVEPIVMQPTNRQAPLDCVKTTKGVSEADFGRCLALTYCYNIIYQ